MSRSCTRSAGFSLLELLLAAALGVVMTTAIAQMFISNSRGQAMLAGQARLQESARHALDFIARSARNAGYLGCGAAGRLTNALNGNWRQVVEIDLSTPIEAFDATAGTWQPSLAALPVRDGGASAFKSRNRIDASRLQPTSDVVVFRRADLGAVLASAVDDAADPIVVAGNADAFRADSFALLSTCGQAALFRVSSLARSGSRTTLVRASGSGPFGNRSGPALLAGGNPYGGSAAPRGAAAALAITETYFVARSTANNNRGQAVQALWRKTSTAAPAELVQGIEDLQLLFGIDTTPTDDSRAPNRYVRADSIGANPVRTVHIAVTASSVDAVTVAEAAGTAGAVERVLVRTFSRTVALRN